MKKPCELWLIWRTQSGQNKNRRRFRIGVLTFDGEKYQFKYDYEHDFLEAKVAGFTFFPGFENVAKDHLYESTTLFTNILSRLPSPERDDYLDVLNRYELDASSDKMEVLATTRGRQITDNFEFVPAFSAEKIEFEVAGVEHREQNKLEKCIDEGFLVPGARLELSLDKDNAYDKYAIRILLPTSFGKVFIGYVPRYYSEQLTEIIERKTEYSSIISKVDLGSKLADEKISVKIRLIFAG